MAQAPSAKLQSIDRMLNPRSVAVVGATERPQYGGRFFRSVLASQDRLRVYPINPRYQEVLGVKCYPRLTDLPETPDLVGVIVPAEAVMPVLEDCAKIKTPSAIVISAGFSERGDAAHQQQQAKLKEFAAQSGVRVCGPNCLGVANIRTGVWASSSAPYPDLKPGPIALISHSGATAFGPLMTRAADMGVGYSHIISTGNEADLESSDFIDHLLDDPDVKVIACFIEGFKDGRKFIAAAGKALEVGKSIVLVKVGRSETGARAAMSHTAALTGSDAVHDAVFKQYGVVRADDYDDLIQAANLLAYAPAPKKEGVMVVSHSGGVSSLIADHLGLNGLSLPPLSRNALGGINKILNGFGWASNPADITGYANRQELEDIMRLLEQEPEAGAVVVATAGRASQAQQVIRLRDKSSKPIIFMTTGGEETEEGLAQLRQSHVPLFDSTRRMAGAMGGFFAHHRRRKLWRQRKNTSSAQKSSAIPTLKPGPHYLTEHASKELLAHWGIPCTREIRTHSAADAVKAAKSLGYPVALKLESEHIPHKTEAGVVRLGLQNDDQVKQAFSEIVASGIKFAPQAKGAPVLVQEMVSDGVEVIVGLSQDPHFGPVLLVGLGGIFVEVFKDTAMRVCPITENDAREMLEELRGAKLLKGFRGKGAADIDALVKAILSVSQLSQDLADRRPELDINPLVVLPKGQGVKAVDARITLHQ
jgi:acetyltransferase